VIFYSTIITMKNPTPAMFADAGSRKTARNTGTEELQWLPNTPRFPDKNAAYGFLIGGHLPYHSIVYPRFFLKVFSVEWRPSMEIFCGKLWPFPNKRYAALRGLVLCRRFRRSYSMSQLGPDGLSRREGFLGRANITTGCAARLRFRRDFVRRFCVRKGACGLFRFRNVAGKAVFAAPGLRKPPASALRVFWKDRDILGADRIATRIMRRQRGNRSHEFSPGLRPFRPCGIPPVRGRIVRRCFGSAENRSGSSGREISPMWKTPRMRPP
jgi:hypothetical protein